MLVDLTVAALREKALLTPGARHPAVEWCPRQLITLSGNLAVGLVSAPGVGVGAYAYSAVQEAAKALSQQLVAL